MGDDFSHSGHQVVWKGKEDEGQRVAGRGRRKRREKGKEGGRAGVAPEIRLAGVAEEGLWVSRGGRG